MIVRDAEIAIERSRSDVTTRKRATSGRIWAMQYWALHFGRMTLLEASTMKCSIQAERRRRLPAVVARQGRLLIRNPVQKAESNDRAQPLAFLARVASRDQRTPA
jgi:hypothetical protein